MSYIMCHPFYYLLYLSMEESVVDSIARYFDDSFLKNKCIRCNEITEQKRIMLLSDLPSLLIMRFKLVRYDITNNGNNKTQYLHFFFFFFLNFKLFFLIYFEKKKKKKKKRSNYQTKNFKCKMN